MLKISLIVFFFVGPYFFFLKHNKYIKTLFVGFIFPYK